MSYHIFNKFNFYLQNTSSKYCINYKNYLDISKYQQDNLNIVYWFTQSRFDNLNHIFNKNSQNLYKIDWMYHRTNMNNLGKVSSLRGMIHMNFQLIHYMFCMSYHIIGIFNCYQDKIYYQCCIHYRSYQDKNIFLQHMLNNLYCLVHYMFSSQNHRLNIFCQNQ